MSQPEFSQLRWDALCERLSLARTDNWFGQLHRRYGEAHRSYHNVGHIADCLQQLDLSPHISQFNNTVELAIWFHDVVYDIKATDNEVASAELAVNFLQECDGPSELIVQTRNLILATQHQAIPTDLESQLMIDIDLSILGRSAERYAEFERQIRIEYDWVPEDVFRSKRAEILSSFLDREPLFLTKWFRATYEVQARENLTRAIEQLTTKR